MTSRDNASCLVIVMVYKYRGLYLTFQILNLSTMVITTIKVCSYQINS